EQVEYSVLDCTHLTFLLQFNNLLSAASIRNCSKAVKLCASLGVDFVTDGDTDQRKLSRIQCSNLRTSGPRGIWRLRAIVVTFWLQLQTPLMMQLLSLSVVCECFGCVLRT